MSLQLTEFETILYDSADRIGTCTYFIMGWLTVVDGHIDSRETEELERIAYNIKTPYGEELLDLACSANIDALLFACEYLRDTMEAEERVVFMQLALGVVMADEVLTNTENNAIRFLCDLLKMGENQLQALSLAQTGEAFPEPIDLSRTSHVDGARYQHYGRSKKTRAHAYSEEREKKHGQYSSEELLAYGALFLEPGATQEEIKGAYKRMAKIHHPDRYVKLGAEAVEVANLSFKKINNAYTLLSEE